MLNTNGIKKHDTAKELGNRNDSHAIADIASRREHRYCENDLDNALFVEVQAVDIDKVKVEGLLRDGANINAVDSWGDNLLMSHIQFQDHYGTNLENIKYLIGLGCDVNYENDGTNCLFHACLTCDADMVELLINNGTNVNCLVEPGESLLDWCLFEEWFQYNDRYPNPEEMTRVVETLKKYGAKTYTAQASQQSPMPTQSGETTMSPKIGSIIRFGTYDWRVLDVESGRALILSEWIIESRCYHPTRKCSSWAECELRGYLNGAFYDTFSPQDRTRIVETKITTYDNPWYYKEGHIKTNDWIFLLSIEEVVDYFGDSGLLENGNPESRIHLFDQYDSARIAKDSSGKADYWWLRTPGEGGYLNAVVVHNCGLIDVSGFNVNSHVGVRPALWLMVP